ncbi:MAG: hypothetical protein K2H40_13295, partial [Lachnospiraceae bacterium]|nr:hypothetical protein [Lachnospiraceae bacterium]
MKIALLNGSPKVKNSSSGILLTDLKRCLSEQPDTDRSAMPETHNIKPEISEIALRHPSVSEE